MINPEKLAQAKVLWAEAEKSTAMATLQIRLPKPLVQRIEAVVLRLKRHGRLGARRITFSAAIRLAIDKGLDVLEREDPEPEEGGELPDVWPRQDAGELLTVREAAAQLKVSTSTIIRWLHEGKLRGHKPRGLWRIPEHAIQAFMK